MGSVSARSQRLDTERQARQAQIAEQVKDGQLTIRKLSTADLDLLERARGRRRVAVILPVEDTPSAA
jgi:hypothetical protein